MSTFIGSTIIGNILSISNDSLKGKDENEKGNYYNIKIQIAPLDTNEMKLRCGMSANAEIKVSERRMIGYFFDNLKLRAHETFSMK